MFEKLKSIGSMFKTELKVYRLVMKDSRTPFVAKVLLGAAIGYAISPIDIIPDFIPIIGHLDDVIIVPGLIFMALKLIPRELVEECRAKVV
ncbi:MAG: DUF1232 domain-containing protein [Deltaproteobacteria bacterium]|nr:DUF1232 domain-containing protein [Deltaproteobacteria bacterium]